MSRLRVPDTDVEDKLLNSDLSHGVLRPHKLSQAREFTNKSAASAASLDYGTFEAMIKTAASAASRGGGAALAAD